MIVAHALRVAKGRGDTFIFYAPERGGKEIQPLPCKPVPIMKTVALFLSLCTVLAAPVAVFAQSPRFETRAADNGAQPVSGTVEIRVGRDGAAATRPEGTRFAVRLSRTSETFACDRLPYTLRWDTKKSPDGWQWIEVLILDPAPIIAPKVIDSLKVYVRNDTATPLPVASPAPRPVSSPLASRRRGRGSSPRLVAFPESVTPETMVATVNESAAPMSVPHVRALCKSANSVYLGLPDGGIAAWDDTAKRGFVVRVGGVLSAVRTLAVGSGMVCWTVTGSDTVYSYRIKERTVTAINAGENGATGATPWIERLAVLGDRVLLMGAAGTRVWDGKTVLEPISEVLPRNVAEQYSDALVRCYIGTDTSSKNALLMLATPDVSGVGGTLRFFSGDTKNLRNGWRDRGTVETTTSLYDAPLALTPTGVLFPEKADGYREARQLSWMNCAGRDNIAAQTLPLGATGDYNARAPQSAELIAAGGSGAWWTQNGVVFHSDLGGTKRECYLPWNGAGNAVSALLADERGAFVATNKGVRRIVPDAPTETNGYNGYVRVPLGDGFTEARTDRDRQLLTGIDEWQGVPYKWGGTTKTGTDCSGFVGAMHQALGVTIPRTSSDMGTTKQGLRVRDELRYGDTLVYPGHVAIYLGNGRTAETVGGDSHGAPGSVSKSTIWRRREVVVKRFLP